MKNAVDKPRIDQLKELLQTLAEAIDGKPGARDLAGLAKQYRETLKEIEEIDGTEGEQDGIEAIIAQRETNGKTGAVRKNRA